MTDYTHGKHTVYHHRYHLVWITKYRYKVLQGELRLRVRSLITQVAEEMGIEIINNAYIDQHADAHRKNHETNISLE
jgi:putative transposase